MLEMRTVTPDEFEQWVRAEARSYGNRLAADPEALRPHFDLDRSVAVFDRGNIVGGSHSHRIEMSIPGGSAVAAGVANVAVQPTHRRQGVMSRMMRHQLEDIHQRGEALSVLFASESGIYGRFGYGMGSMREEWSIQRQYTEFTQRHESAGRFFFVDPVDIGKELSDVARRSTKDRPGVIQKAPHLWERESRASVHREGGPGGLFYVAYEDAGKVEGYVKYRTSGNTLTVNELMATNKDATAALWRFCFDLDLITNTEAERRPLDDPLPWMLIDPRRLQRTTRDGLWLRLVDAAAALEMRGYTEAGRLVLEVRDDVCTWNQGRFELETSTEGATCRPSDSSPDLTTAVSALASAYLGTASFATLSQTALVDEHTPGALLRADRMFAVQHKPWTPFNF